MRSGLNGQGLGADGIEQLRSSDEHHACAGQGQDQPARSGIHFHVVARPFHGADGDRIDDQPRFRACLDRKESPDFVQHRHSLTVERVIRGFEPFSR
jgi:hypothetical protein